MVNPVYITHVKLKKVKIIEHYFASSEDAKILKYAKKYGYNLIKRPKFIKN